MNSKAKNHISVQNLLKILWYHYGLTLILALLVIPFLIITNNASDIMLILLVAGIIFFFNTLPFQLYYLIKQRFKGASIHFTKIGIWILVFTIGILQLNSILDHYIDSAEQLAEAVEQFHVTKNRYPNLREFESFRTLMPEPNRVYYQNSLEKGLTLFYISPVMIFSQYEYDFKTKEWEYIPD